MQAQEEKDIDDEIDEFDYQFDAPGSEQSLPTAQASTLASSIDAIFTDNAAAEPELASMKMSSQTKDNGRDESNKVAVAGEAITEEDEFEYHIVENKDPDDGHLNNRVVKENKLEEKAIDSKYDETDSENSTFDYQMVENKLHDEDQFEYQMEEEKNIEKAKTVSHAEKDTTGEDEFEYAVEEDVADEGEFEYELDDKADEELVYDVEEKGAEEDEFEYQMEDKVVEEGKIDKSSPVLTDEQVSNEVQDDPSGEDEFEYQMEAHDLEESKDNIAKHAKNVEVKSNETEDKVAQDSDFEYEMKETKNGNSVKDKDDEGGDEFEYQLEDSVAEEDEFDYKSDNTNKEKNLDTNVEQDEFEYNLIDESDGVETSGIPNTGDLCEGKDPSEFGEEEEEFAFDYELPDDEVEDPKQSTVSKKCTKEALEEHASKVDFSEKDAEPLEDEFDYDVEEYETEISTVSGALGKVSDEVKKQIADDNNSSDENTSSNLSSEKIESAKSSPLKFKIPPVTPYSSDAAHNDAVDSDLCKTVKSASISSVSDEINITKPQEETISADVLTSAAPPAIVSAPPAIVSAPPAIVSAPPLARNPSTSPQRPLGKSPVKISTRTQSRSSPDRGSATSPQSIPHSSLNRATTKSPVRASTSYARNPVASPTLTATLSADLVTEAKKKVDYEKHISELVTEGKEKVEYKKDISKLEDSVVRGNIEDKDDIKCTLPINSKIVESLEIKSEQDVLSDQIQECKQTVGSNLEAVEYLGSKSSKVENVESTPVKVNVVDSENVKKISEKYEDDEETSRSRIAKRRARTSRSTPVKATGVSIDDDTEAVVSVSRRVGAKRGRASTTATAAEEESQENEELAVTPAKRPARNRSLKQEFHEESKETVEILLEVIDELNSSPQKKAKASRRNTKGRTVLSADSDDDASETLPASNHEEEEENMKDDEEKNSSPRGRRGGRARRGNSTKVSPKNLNVSIDAEEDPINEGRAAGSRKREAPTNSDDEGSVCSVTRGGRTSKRGRGGAATRGTAAPNTPGASSRKMAAVTKTPAVGVKATPTAVHTPQPGSGGKGKQTRTPAAEPRCKRRSYAPVRYE